MPLLRRAATPEAAAAEAAEHLAVRVAEDVARRGRAAVALAGGRTPELLYAALVARAGPPRDGAPPPPWDRVDWFFSDERAVPANDPRSNLGLARRGLFEPLRVPPVRIRALRGDAPDLDAEALRAEAELREATGGGLDVVLLGMGPDGHVASLFPGSPALDEARRLVVVAEPGMEPRVPRLTMTFAAINAAREVLVLATGAAKAPVLKRVLVDHDATAPATRVRPASRRVAWFVDHPAAADLRP